MGGAPAQPQVQQNPLNDIFGGGVQQPQLIQTQPPAQSLGGLGDIFGGGSAMGGNPMGGLPMAFPHMQHVVPSQTQDLDQHRRHAYRRIDVQCAAVATDRPWLKH